MKRTASITIFLVTLCFLGCVLFLGTAVAADLNELVRLAKDACERVHVENSSSETTCKQGVDEAMKQITLCRQNPEQCGMNEQGQLIDGGFLLSKRCDIINPKGTRAPGGLSVMEAPLWYGCSSLVHLYATTP